MSKEITVFNLDLGMGAVIFPIAVQMGFNLFNYSFGIMK
jgi:hypothetical protein